jgi:hypothetical protein
MMAPQTLAETLRQDSLKRAEREEALTQYIRAALAEREAEARRAAQQPPRRATSPFSWAVRVLARVHI